MTLSSTVTSEPVWPGTSLPGDAPSNPFLVCGICFPDSVCSGSIIMWLHVGRLIRAGEIVVVVMEGANPFRALRTRFSI